MHSRDADTLELLAQEGVNTGYLFFVPRKEVAPRYEQYLRLWKRAGHKEKPNIGYWVLVYVDETDEKAMARAKVYFTLLLHQSLRHAGRRRHRLPASRGKLYEAE